MKPTLSPENIDSVALDIVSRLQKNNFTTYLVGGCVRDLLVGITPKDFDIVTMARPEQVQKIIRPSFIIGRRFRLVLVRRYQQQYEIATFRALTYQNEDNPDEFDENIYGEPQEDALRRDFTINGLFYDPIKNETIDYTQGMDDISKRMIRMIGDPIERIEQDPIRILRALRLAHRTGFQIEPSLRQGMQQKAELLKTAVLPRVREEILKILRLPSPHLTLIEGSDMGIFANIAPRLSETLLDPERSTDFVNLLRVGLDAVGRESEPADLYAVLLYAYLASNKKDWCTSLSTSFEETFIDFIRTELGMHKNEFELFEQTIGLLRQLIKHGDPSKLRTRHRVHLANNRAFPLALTFAQSFHHLEPSLLHRWANVLHPEKEGPSSADTRKPDNRH
ncbi:MAG: poly(A) polymerase [Bdellovibrionaceae bacterium]|nr:poly(A) polymerase [Pseudobdellovibrionaceae bacterium]